MKVKATRSWPTLCDNVDYTVHGILWARILEWLPFPSPGDLPNPGLKLSSPTLEADSLPAEPPGKPENTGVGSLSLLKGIFLTQESNQGLLPADRFFTSGAKLASTSMFQKIGGNCPSVRFPHLETARKILHIICMYVSMEVYRFSHP